MRNLTIRRASTEDAATVARLMDGFARTHPAARHARCHERMSEAFFGDAPLAYVLLAEKDSIAIGFAAWRRTYDMYWSMFGGEGIGLYVEPRYRGFGVAACILAAMCAGIREQGGEYLTASYGAEWAAFYERVAIGGDDRTCHLSARAFDAVADVAGRSAREIVRALPGKDLNFAGS